MVRPTKGCTTLLTKSQFALKILTLGGVAIPTGFGNPSDFEAWSRTFFNGLEKLCTFANDYVDNSIQNFLSSPMLTYQMVSRSTFDDDASATVSRFQETLPITFAQTLELLRDITRGNGLVAVSSINWFTAKRRRVVNNEHVPVD